LEKHCKLQGLTSYESQSATYLHVHLLLNKTEGKENWKKKEWRILCESSSFIKPPENLQELFVMEQSDWLILVS